MSSLVRELGAIEVFRDFDLHVAEITLASHTFPLLLVRVCGFLCAWWTALEATVPVMGDESLALVFLGGSMGVDVVNVGEVGLKPGIVRKVQ